MGFKEPWLGLVVKLQVRFKDEKLYVAREYMYDMDLPAVLTALMFKTLRFRKWSDSRWLSVGESCRTLLGACLLGLPQLVRYIIASGRASKYFIGGMAEHSTPKVMHMACIVATSSFASDVVVGMLMKDDRLARQLDTIDRVVRESIHRTERTHPSVWAGLAALAQLQPRTLCNDAVDAAVTSGAYLAAKLREARRLPWSLCRGDHAMNLARLEAGAEPEELVSKKIWEGLRIGMPRSIFLEGLRLMEQCCWTANATEQAHRSASGLIRQHRQYSAETLQARSLVAQSLPLWAVSQEGKKIDRLQSRLVRVLRRKPKLFTGRQLYVRELNAEASKTKRNGRLVPARIQKQIMKKQSGAWAAMPRARRADYELRSIVAREERRQLHYDEANKVMQAIAELSNTISKRSSAENPLRMSRCKWSADMVKKFEEAMGSTLYSNKRLRKLRQARPCKVGPARSEVQRVLEGIELPTGRAARASPGWARPLAYHRSYFQSCIFRFERAGCCEYWKFALGVQ